MVGCILTMVAISSTAGAQDLGGAGTIQGTVKDPTGGAMVAVTVNLSNAVTGLKRETTTDATGRFVFRNLPPNPYSLQVSAQGFQNLERAVDVRTSVPIDLSLAMTPGVETSVEVVGRGDLVELSPTAHTDLDQSLVDKLPISTSGGLNQVISLAVPGVVADSNGFFHPIGDHAQTQFSIDNQPVTDQQSRIYSNQISSDAVQSMEVITGVPPAEFGDKDSLVVQIVTKSGLDHAKPTGSFTAGYGSFKSPTGEANLGFGSHGIGNFLSVSGLTTDRFLDSPEFTAMHDHGDKQSIFDRMDAHPNSVDSYHLNVQFGRSSFDIPNTYDAQCIPACVSDQADGPANQHQTITSINVAPGYSRVLNSSLLLSANGYLRQDHVVYTPSANPFNDIPGSVSQDRKLANFGGKVDIGYASGSHNIKFGASVTATKLTEKFSLGLTDPAENSPCVDDGGSPVGDPSLVSTNQCAGAGLTVNDGFAPGLVPFDLSRGSTTLYNFNATDTIKQQAAYVQDDITAGNASLKLGVRVDHYDGLTSQTAFEPRAGLSYSVPSTKTVFRASYGRTMETPYNENLLLSSLADPAVFGTSGLALPPGTRDQIEAGVQQALGRWLVVDVGYFYKHTTNGYDFGVLFDTPIAFPVAWDHSNLDGITGRVNLVEHGGLTAYTVFGHTNAFYFPPGTGGLLTDQPAGEFRIDHDQKFQETSNVQYTFSKAIGAWAALSWQYESGLVAGAVTDYATALSFGGDQQAAIGLFCGGTSATATAPLTGCPAGITRGATRVVIPADGTEDDVTNPPRIASRNLFDLGLGVDNLFQSKTTKVRLRFSVVNLTNNQALYNFLSTFSGTHFVTPRSYQAQVGITF